MEHDSQNIEREEISEDVVFEDEGEGQNLQAVIKDLRKKIREIEKEKGDILTDLQRTKADFINLRKRDEEEKKHFTSFATREFITNLLPVLDSLEQALNHSKGVKEIGDVLLPIQSQFMNILQGLGVSRLNPEGANFDPNLHEAIRVTAVNDEKLDNHILSVLQVGYMMHDKIIRAPKVEVGQFDNKGQ